MSIKVNFVCQDREVWAGDAQIVILPASGGELGIMANHEPVMASLKEGNVKIDISDNDTTDPTIIKKISGGFASFYNNSMSIVVDDIIEDN